ncbi:MULTISPECIES: hypothetical protein [Nocardia]|uniref:hypothetical protein n=1 Tax=Nocardia TaxID=1817 RepID=UPI00189586F6|nr:MULTISPECIES: hypothetical protein [Nocardia]MBF6350998.1 hypothetical protein [Nocardia flavorosea]
MPRSTPRDVRSITVAGALSLALLWITAPAVLFYSLLLPLGVPGCSPGPGCETPPILLAWLVTWAAVPVGIGMSCTDINRRGQVRVPVQLLSTGILLLGGLLGTALMG